MLLFGATHAPASAVGFQVADALAPLGPRREQQRRRSPEQRARNLPPPPAELPEKPEQYGVYRGRVSNIMDFGCFVELAGLRARCEGLVHLANITKTRCQCLLRMHACTCHSNGIRAVLRCYPAQGSCYPSALGCCGSPARCMLTAAGRVKV